MNPSLRRAGKTFAALMILLSLAGCIGSRENRAPVAVFDADPREGYAPLTVHFDASGSYDPDGNPMTYEWTFGDGASGVGRATAHTYDAGSYQAMLRVTDTQGATSLSTMAIDVRPVPDGYLLRHYEWPYDGRTQEWDVLIDEGLYDTYHARVRSTLADTHDYGAYVADPLDDPTMETLAEALWNRAGRGYEPFVECTLAFVQGAIDYQVDPSTTEWPLYPMETLVEGAGDCEDTTILFVSLLLGRGYPSKIAFVDTDDDRTPDHVLALVPVSTAYLDEIRCDGSGRVTVLWYSGDPYVVAETAVSIGEIRFGCDPWFLEVEDVSAVWDVEP
jgi:PKD repeat protein